MIVLEVAHTLRASSGRDDLRNSSEHDREIACVEKKQNKTKQKTKTNKKQTNNPHEQVKGWRVQLAMPQKQSVKLVIANHHTATATSTPPPKNHHNPHPALPLLRFVVPHPLRLRRFRASAARGPRGGSGPPHTEQMGRVRQRRTNKQTNKQTHTHTDIGQMNEHWALVAEQRHETQRQGSQSHCHAAHLEADEPLHILRIARKAVRVQRCAVNR